MRSSSRILRSPKLSEDSLLIENEPLPVENLSAAERVDVYEAQSILEISADGVLIGGGPDLVLEEEAAIAAAALSTDVVTEVPKEPTPQEIAEAEAESMLAEAREQIAAALAEAEATKEQVFAEARDEGYRAGFAAGSAEGVRTGRHLSQVLKDITDRLVREEQRMVRTVEARLARLSLEIARKVIREELKTGSAGVEELVKLSLLPFKEEEHVSVRLNPTDLAVLRESQDEVVNLFDPSGSLKIIEDRRVSRGGCIVETPSGRLDARYEAQLDRVADVIEEEASYGAHADAVDKAAAEASGDSTEEDQDV